MYFVIYGITVFSAEINVTKPPIDQSKNDLETGILIYEL